ncbi:MAG: hypothetical protein ACE5IA_07295, partial [Dehalococcoidia bacterium]
SGLKENVIIGKLIPARSYEPPPEEEEQPDEFAIIAQQRLGETAEEPTGEAPAAAEELPFAPEAVGEPEDGGAEDIVSGPEAELVAVAEEEEEAAEVSPAPGGDGGEAEATGELEGVASEPEAEAAGEDEPTPVAEAGEEDKTDPA